MAEIHVTNDGEAGATLPAGAPAAGLNRTPETDPEHLLAERAGPGTPGTVAASDDPDVVRGEIEQTRARMSSTIDALESALLRKKEQIEEKLDVTAPVRERVNQQPWLYAGGVFAGGLLLGYLTGGGDDDEEYRGPRGNGGARAIPTMAVSLDATDEEAYGTHWRERAQQWERRSRELMKTCNRQEREIRDLRASIGGVEEGGGGLLGAVTSGLSGLVAGTVSRFTGGGAQGELDVEVELEQPHGTPHPYYDRPPETRETAGYGPTTGTSSYGTQGELDVEVELEQPHGTPHPYYDRPPEYREERYATTRTAYTSPQPRYGGTQGEMQVEVELEEEGGRKGLLMGVVGAVITAGVAGAVARFFAGQRRETELEAEVELERPAYPPPAPAYTPPPPQPAAEVYTVAADRRETVVEVELEEDRTLPGGYGTTASTGLGTTGADLGTAGTGLGTTGYGTPSTGYGTTGGLGTSGGAGTTPTGYEYDRAPEGDARSDLDRERRDPAF